MVVSGLSFFKISDWSFDPRYPITFDYSKIKDGDRVFLNLDYFINFYKQINQPNKKKIVLITHNSDKSFTDEHYNMIKDYVYRIYAINNTCRNNNVVTIPIAFQDWPKNHFNLIVGLSLKHKSFEKKNLIYMNFSIGTNPVKRTQCFNYFNSYDWVTKKSNISKEEFMNDLLHSKYVISPEGAGIDCHRIYEAIAVGTIPIVKKTHTAMDEFYTKLPIILVEDWNEVTYDFLINDYNIYKNTLDHWLDTNKGWMTPEHWIQKLHFISFGDEKYTKTKLRLKKQALESKFFSSVNLYSPQDFGNDFKHRDFCLTNSRGYGYWIWKLYFILKKIKEIQYNDVLVFADAGSSVNKNGKKRLQEYLSFLNDEKDNDILCFQMIHLEHKYTKNDIFEFFNTNEEVKNSGQFVGGVLFIRKTNRIISFFEKLYEINSNNYNFIDDSPSKTKNHPDFIDNRHDQSTFSVLIKSEYNNKVVIPEETWPQINDDWKLISHVPILATRLRF
jgi:hypothetical protein